MRNSPTDSGSARARVSVLVRACGRVRPRLRVLALSVLLAAAAQGLCMPVLHAQDATPRWLALHREAVVADGHNDLLYSVMHGVDITRRTNVGHSDLVRFREGGVDLQFLSIWLPRSARRSAADARAYAMREIDSLEAIARRAPDALRIVRSRADVDAAVRDGALAALIAFEGAYPLDGSLDNLRAFHARGVRCIAPTWNDSVPWASSSVDESAPASRGRGAKTGRARLAGLTPHGRMLVRAMDSLGILLDVSHLGERATADLLDAVRSPVIASHSGCRALRDHHRNLRDEQIRAIAARGGVVMVNFFPPYLRMLPRTWAARTAKANAAIAALRLPQTGWSVLALSAADSIIARAARDGLVTLRDVADHIDHIVKLGGAGAAGLGTDFDGIDQTPVGIPDISYLPLLTRELMRRGYTDADIRAILGGNTLRLL